MDNSIKTNLHTLWSLPKLRRHLISSHFISLLVRLRSSETWDTWWQMQTFTVETHQCSPHLISFACHNNREVTLFMRMTRGLRALRWTVKRQWPHGWLVWKSSCRSHVVQYVNEWRVKLNTLNEFKYFGYEVDSIFINFVSIRLIDDGLPWVHRQ